MVLAPEPSLVAQLVEHREHMRVVDFAGIRFMPVRHARDLDMAAARDVLTQPSGEVAIHDLHVIAINLHLQIGQSHGFADARRLSLRIREIAGHIARIDGLDQDGYVSSHPLRGPTQVPDVYFAARSRLCYSCENVHPRAFQGLAIAQPDLNTVAKFFLAARVTRHATLAAVPVARWRIDKRAFEPRRAQAFRYHLFRMGVRTKNLNALESRVGGSLESIEERKFLKECIKVSGELQHLNVPSKVPAPTPRRPAAS